MSASEEDDRALRRVAAGLSQQLISVGTVASARVAIEEVRPQVVICDADMKGPEFWRDLLEVDGKPASFAVVVVSRHPDERLWTEVLNRGGFDVLGVPFRRQEVEWVISSALRRLRIT